MRIRYSCRGQRAGGCCSGLGCASCADAEWFAAGGGVDYGHVYGPSTANIIGRQLAGGVIGLRGGWATRFGSLSYDLFAGTPIHKPSGFTTVRITTGFNTDDHCKECGE